MSLDAELAALAEQYAADLTADPAVEQAPDKFYDEVYRLPADLLKGKQNITVRFQSHPGTTAGGVFGTRVMKVKQ